MHSCRLCGVEKPSSEFYKNSNRKEGIHSRCKSCCKEKARERQQRLGSDLNEYQREWRRKNPGKSRAYRLKRAFGFTEEQLARLPQACQLCERENDLCLDHCHDTGNFRGVLCRTCNAGIGFLKDDPVLVKKALEYLNDKQD